MTSTEMDGARTRRTTTGRLKLLPSWFDGTSCDAPFLWVSTTALASIKLKRETEGKREEGEERKTDRGRVHVRDGLQYHQ